MLKKKGKILKYIFNIEEKSVKEREKKDELFILDNIMNSNSQKTTISMQQKYIQKQC